MAWKTLDDMELAGKIVLTRVDVNVPVKDGRVSDDTRIRRIAPTIRDILKGGGKPVMLAHFGRPKGQPVPALSLRIVIPALEAALGTEVTFLEKPDRAAIDALPPDAVVLVENTRFTLMEEANDPRMAQFLASLGDIYCNDAFSAAHRAHASTEGVAHLLPSCAGRLMEAELRALEAALSEPVRPVLAIVGGAKVSTKLDLLGNLVRKVDTLVIGGGMANTFLAAQGHEVGNSLAEHDRTDTARDILLKAEEVACKVILPIDVAVADTLEKRDTARYVPLSEVGPTDCIFDAGPKTVTQIKSALQASKTFVMNGPLGIFEVMPYHKATFDVIDEVARLTDAGGLISIAGGGDTVAAINSVGHGARFSYISTAGGAFLEWLEGKTLPGIAALDHD
jgi:phosphoglycerate kinase